jgi:poly-beta-1,6-N-acetyl-D-glucosamine synthase
MTKQISYVVVTPARDEAQHISLTIDSPAAQSIKPARWIIVNDGSKDETGRIADDAARSRAWITVVNRVDRGFRKAGGGVVGAFYEGYRCVVELLYNQFVDELSAFRRSRASETGAGFCPATG